MNTNPSILLLLVPLLALAACDEETLSSLPPPPVTASDVDSLQDEAEASGEEPAADPAEELECDLPVPTCNFYLLRPEEGKIAFYVDVEGVRWESVALTVSDEVLHWRLMQTGPDGTLAVPLDLNGRWSVEAVVITPEGDMLPCGSLTAPTAP